MGASIVRHPVSERKRALRRALMQARQRAASTQAQDEALACHMAILLGAQTFSTIGFYWPLTGEFDVRVIVSAWLAGDAGRRAALPVIRQPGMPLEFHAWTSGASMRAGHHGIPEPVTDEKIIPDLLLIPCIGFDSDGYRLGYGGGYYDRTLAAWPANRVPVTVGVAYEMCRVNALPRDVHDLPLDYVVTDGEVLCRAGFALPSSPE